jgi:hypothetical protein
MPHVQVQQFQRAAPKRHGAEERSVNGHRDLAILIGTPQASGRWTSPSED